MVEPYACSLRAPRCSTARRTTTSNSPRGVDGGIVTTMLAKRQQCSHAGLCLSTTKGTQALDRRSVGRIEPKRAVECGARIIELALGREHAPKHFVRRRVVAIQRYGLLCLFFRL